MAKLTVKDLLEAKGKRRLTYVQVARVEEAATACSRSASPPTGNTSRMLPAAHFPRRGMWSE